MEKFDYESYSNGFKFKAGIHLVKILKDINDDVLSRKVTSRIHLFYEKTKALEKVESNKYYKYYLSCLYTETKKNILNNNMPTDVKTYLANVISTIYKINIAKRKK